MATPPSQASHRAGRPASVVLLGVLGASLACGSSPPPEPPDPVPAPAAARPPPTERPHQPDDAEMKAALAKVRAAAEKARDARTAPDPLYGMTRAQICSTDRVLLKWSFAELQSGYGTICCAHPEGLGPDGNWCGLDWPFSDVPPCAAYDDMRNAIFAYYGFPFTTERYRTQYADVDWYVPRDDFDADWLPTVARENVATLKQLKADRVACMPEEMLR